MNNKQTQSHPMDRAPEPIQITKEEAELLQSLTDEKNTLAPLMKMFTNDMHNRMRDIAYRTRKEWDAILNKYVKERQPFAHYALNPDTGCIEILNQEELESQ